MSSTSFSVTPSARSSAGAAAAGLLIVGAPGHRVRADRHVSAPRQPNAHATASGNSEGAPHWTISKQVLKPAASSEGRGGAGRPAHLRVRGRGRRRRGGQGQRRGRRDHRGVRRRHRRRHRRLAQTAQPLYIAQTGQYSVIATNTATGAQSEIEVGAYRRTSPSHPTAHWSTRRSPAATPARRVESGRRSQHRDEHADGGHHRGHRPAPGSDQPGRQPCLRHHRERHLRHQHGDVARGPGDPRPRRPAGNRHLTRRLAFPAAGDTSDRPTVTRTRTRVARARHPSNACLIRRRRLRRQSSP